MKKIVVLLGIPGSGKGTQASFITEKFGHRHISTGVLLRRLDADPNADPTDKAKIAAMKSGHLVDSELIYRLVFNEVNKEIAAGRGVILDGAIRTLEQAEHYQEFFAQSGWADEVQAIHLAMPDEVSVARLSRRGVCTQCNFIVTQPQGGELTVCPKCGGAVVKRVDDQPEVVRERLHDQGNAALKPLVDFYQSCGALITVDATQDIEHVAADIAKVLE